MKYIPLLSTKDILTLHSQLFSKLQTTEDSITLPTQNFPCISVYEKGTKALQYVLKDYCFTPTFHCTPLELALYNDDYVLFMTEKFGPEYLDDYLSSKYGLSDIQKEIATLQRQLDNLQGIAYIYKKDILKQLQERKEEKNTTTPVFSK